MMTIDDAITHLDLILGYEPLNALHEEIFRQAWQGKTYEEIAVLHHYDTDYIRHLGQQLWQRLSKQMDRRVTKNNLRVVFRQHHQYVLSPLQIMTQSPAKSQLEANGYSPNGHGSESTVPTHRFPDEVPVTAPTCLGRYGSLRTLQQWSDRARLIAILGIGGVGKTTLARQLVKQVQDQFEVVIWRSLRNGTPFPTFMEDITTACPGSPPPQVNIDHQINQLLTYFQKRRCLIILDNFESILQSQVLSGQYQPDHAPYGQLLRTLSDHAHQSCVMLTSREMPVGLVIREAPHSPVQLLHLDGLSAIATQSLMATHDIDLSEEEAQTLCDTYAGNPYALKMAAVTIRDLFQGNVRHWLRQGHFVYGNIHQLFSQQIKRLTTSENTLIHCLAQRTMDLAQLQSALSQQVSLSEVLESLQSLLGRSLLESSPQGFHLHRGIQHYLQLDCDR